MFEGLKKISALPDGEGNIVITYTMTMTEAEYNESLTKQEDSTKHRHNG